MQFRRAGLSCAVWPDDAEYLALGYLAGDALQSLHSTEAQMNILELHFNFSCAVNPTLTISLLVQAEPTYTYPHLRSTNLSVLPDESPLGQEFDLVHAELEHVLATFVHGRRQRLTVGA